MLMTTAKQERSRLRLPEGQSVDWFLQSLDSRPRLMPDWPLSDRMTLVALVSRCPDRKDDVDGEAFVITEKTEIDGLIKFDMPLRVKAVLFFTVLRSRVMPFCELNPDDWPAEAQE